MHTAPYSAPRPAAREELKVSILHRGSHRKFKLHLRDGETYYVMISAILNSVKYRFINVLHSTIRLQL